MSTKLDLNTAILIRLIDRKVMTTLVERRIMTDIVASPKDRDLATQRYVDHVDDLVERLSYLSSRGELKRIAALLEGAPV